MRALVIDAPGRTRLGTVTEPRPAAGEVLVRVRTVGFCGSDLSTFRGANPLVSYPRVPGHEIAGVVEAVGAEVPDTVRVGTDVTVVPYTACGACAACRRGRVNTCRHNRTLGVQRDGAMTALVAVPWAAVLAADGLSRSALALVEPLSVGAHADRVRHVGARRLHHAGDLVARHARVADQRVRAAEGAQVGAAEADRAHADEHLVRRRARRRQLPEPDAPRCVDHEGPHARLSHG